MYYKNTIKEILGFVGIGIFFCSLKFVIDNNIKTSEQIQDELRTIDIADTDEEDTDTTYDSEDVELTQEDIISKGFEKGIPTQDE